MDGQKKAELRGVALLRPVCVCVLCVLVCGDLVGQKKTDAASRSKGRGSNGQVKEGAAIIARECTLPFVCVRVCVCVCVCVFVRRGLCMHASTSGRGRPAERDAQQCP